MSKPRHRCSSLPRIFGCNGSLSAFPRVKRRESDDGHEGSVLHFLIASRLIDEHGAVAPEGGLPPPQVPDGYTLPAFSAWIVDWAVRHVLETIPPDWTLMVEVELYNEFETWALEGHSDIIGISPDATRAKVIDWKTGPKPVEPASSNEQVAGYICLCKIDWPSLIEIEGQIAQPRVDEETGFERISTVTLAGDLLERLPTSIDRRMVAAMANDMELNTGPQQCAHCIGCSCPAIRAEGELMKMKMTPEVLASIKETPDDATLGDFVVASKVLSGPIEEAREMIVERLKANGYVDAGDGTRITMKTQGGKLKVAHPQGAWAAVKSLVPDDRIPDVVSYSKTRLVDVIADVRGCPKSGKSAVTGEGLFDSEVRPYMEQGEKNILIFSAP